MAEVQSRINLDFNPELFNNVYWHLEKAFHDLKVRFIWLYGGSSASKTYSVVQLIIKEMLSGSNENSLILRKYNVDLKDSIFSDFKNIINEWQLNHLFIIQQNFIQCVTGSYARFRGLDDSEKIKGITGFKRIILEEVNQFEQEDFKQIKKRLRGKLGQQIIGIFNPISELHWIKVQIFDQEVLTEQELTTNKIAGMWINADGNIVVMKTNYLDNIYIVGKWAVNPEGKLVQIGGFVDEHVIADFEKDKEVDRAYYDVYGLGDWGKLRTGGEFWKDFNQNSHIKKAGQWNEDLPLHMTWDKNVNPYLPCSIWQIDPRDNSQVFIQIDEICLEDPRNRVRHVCDDFKSKYPVDRVKGLFIYGDRTAKVEDTTKEKGENFFTDILKELDDYHPVLRLQTVNPSVVQSGGFVNEMYAERIPGLRIEIWDNCRKSIHDYSYALEDKEGGISKKLKKNPVTKISYQEFGHLSDAKRYFITVVASEEYGTYRYGKKGSTIRTGKNPSKGNW